MYKTIRSCDWKPEEVEILVSKFKEGLTYKEIGAYFNKRADGISKKLIKLGYERHNKPFTEKQKEEIIRLYNQGVSANVISKNFNSEHSVIIRYLKQAGIKIRDKKYNINTKFFEVIDTEEKAYILGFLYADGYVSKNRDKGGIQWGISLQESDKHILEKFNTILKYEKPLSVKKLDNPSHQNQYTLFNCNRKIWQDLINLGLYNNKSLTLTFPTETQVPKEFQRHFIRGYFDGDGSVGNTKTNKWFHLLGTNEFLTKVQNILLANTSINKTKISKTGNVFLLQSGSMKDIPQIHDYLYKNATIYLERKKDKFYIGV